MLVCFSLQPTSCVPGRYAGRKRQHPTGWTSVGIVVPKRRKVRVAQPLASCETLKAHVCPTCLPSCDAAGEGSGSLMTAERLGVCQLQLGHCTTDKVHSTVGVSCRTAARCCKSCRAPSQHSCTGLQSTAGAQCHQSLVTSADSSDCAGQGDDRGAPGTRPQGDV